MNRPPRPHARARRACGGLPIPVRTRLMRAALVVSAALLVGLLTSSCGQGAGGGGRLVITGSSTVAPLMQEIALEFEARRPGCRVDVQTGGSARGITDVREGVADVGMCSRALKASEQDLVAFTVALDGICLIVHRDNPVRELSRAQVIAIYTGAVTNWQEVGAPPSPITVVHKAAGRSTQELFLEYFALENSAVAADVVIGDNEQGVKTVAGNPGAIGYVSVGTAEFDAAAGVPIRLLPMDGVPASVESVASGTFPLSRQLNLVVQPDPDALAIDLLEFAQSEAVADLVHRQFFVPPR